MDEDIELPQSSAYQYLTADICYNLLGKIVNLLYQPPILRVVVELEDGSYKDYRAIRPMVDNQVLIDPFADTTDSAERFLLYGGLTSRRVRSIRFYSSAPWAFQDTFSYRLKQVSFDTFRSLPSTKFTLRDQSTAILRGVTYGYYGDILLLSLIWEENPAFTTEQAASYAAFVGVQNENGDTLAGATVLLQEGHENVVDFEEGGKRYVVTRHHLQLPKAQPPGTFDVSVGLSYLEDNDAVVVGSELVEKLITTRQPLP